MSSTATTAPGAPPAPNAARTAGLSAAAQRLHTQLADALRRQRVDEAEQALAALSAFAPAHPEVQRLHAMLLHQRKRYGEAVGLLRRALEQRPRDALIWNNLGSVFGAADDIEGAQEAFQRCAELEPERAANWFNLGRVLDLQGRVAEAREALLRSLELDPTHVAARVSLGRVLQFLGRIDEAHVEYRRVLADAPQSALAWFGLSTLRTARFDAADVEAMQNLYSQPGLRADDRIAAGFALSKALEDQDRHTESFAILTTANAAKRRQLDWDASTFSRYIGSIAEAFARPPAHAQDATLGREVIFIVGLPRSGSTLVEQILAAHPSVAGGNELLDLPDTLEEESRRRGSRFPTWIHQTEAADWERLGRRYLERTARWREQRPLFTDKGLSNWRYVGAVAAMLPGARFIDCRRDPVETCLACFRQLFAKEQAFTYDLSELAAFWRDYDRMMQTWQQRYPDKVHRLVHEDLLADPEREIHRLLDFCALPFDAACLRFHEVEREVRTASAAQVREPLRKSTARADRYGDLLAPLRRALSTGA